MFLSVTPSRVRLLVGILLLSWLIMGCGGANAPDAGVGNGSGNTGGGSTDPGPDVTNGVFVRRNVKSLSPEQLADFRAGIERMQSRPADQPDSWIYQANIHGTLDTPTQTAWNSCQLGSWFFPSWHRMYLYYMEKILREAVRDATGDPNRNFALPYWNYSDPADPDARRIPEPYRTPADSSNVLFVSNRSGIMNAGGTLPPTSVLLTALDRTNFSSAPGSGMSFAGQRSGPGHLLGPHGRFERTPHDVIHGNIGGGMAEFEFAARDPVFWLHHTNIDRLWEQWLRMGGGRANPSGAEGAPWLSQTFEFFDPDANGFVTKTGAEIVDTAAVLDYRYDDVPVDEEEETESVAPQEESEPMQPVTLTEKDTSDVEIQNEPVTFSIEVVEEESEDRAGELTLRLEDVRVDSVPEGHYEVYVNVPDGVTPDYRSDHYVGNMGFFGVSPNDETAQFDYSLAELEQRLRSEGAWTGEIRVTLIKSGPEPPPNFVVEESEPATVRIGKIRVTRE